MGTFLDAQISQNISFSGGIAIPLSSTPALFGTLGLNTAGADYRPPNPGNSVYQAFISIPGGIVLVPTRTGPESLNAAAYSD